MHLNPFGQIAAEEWLNTIDIRKNITLGEYIIMPNHMHGIISINYKMNDKGKENIGKFISPSHTIGAIIRGYKGASTKRINSMIREINDNPNEKNSATGVSQYAPSLSGQGSIWQRNYWDNIIWNERAYRNISNYIKNNPANWKKDKFK